MLADPPIIKVPVTDTPFKVIVVEGETVLPAPFTPPFWYTSVLESPVAIVNIWFVVDNKPVSLSPPRPAARNKRPGDDPFE
jgi:hypothetical protein